MRPVHELDLAEAEEEERRRREQAEKEKQARKTIGDLADELNYALADLEDVYEREGFILAAEVPMGGDRFFLGWGKVEGEYSFCLRVGTEAPVPLARASLAIRIAAAGHFDDLWEACVKKREAGRDELVAAIKKVRDRIACAHRGER